MIFLQGVASGLYRKEGYNPCSGGTFIGIFYLLSPWQCSPANYQHNKYNYYVRIGRKSSTHKFHFNTNYKENESHDFIENVISRAKDYNSELKQILVFTIMRG